MTCLHHNSQALRILISGMFGLARIVTEKLWRAMQTVNELQTIGRESMGMILSWMMIKWQKKCPIESSQLDHQLLKYD